MRVAPRLIQTLYNKRGTAEQWIKEGKQATAEPAIALGLPDPLPERFGRAPQLARNRLDRGPLGRVLSPMLADQPHRSLSYFGGIPTQS